MSRGDGSVAPAGTPKTGLPHHTAAVQAGSSYDADPSPTTVPRNCQGFPGLRRGQDRALWV